MDNWVDDAYIEHLLRQVGAPVSGQTRTAMRNSLRQAWDQGFVVGGTKPEGALNPYRWKVGNG